MAEVILIYDHCPDLMVALLRRPPLRLINRPLTLHNRLVVARKEEYLARTSCITQYLSFLVQLCKTEELLKA